MSICSSTQKVAITNIFQFIVGYKKETMHKDNTLLNLCTSSNSSKISTKCVENIMNKLLANQNRDSTSKIYLAIWRQFNKFVIKLDQKPPSWEDRVNLFIAFKIQSGMRANSAKSYVSAIKRLLTDDGYQWDDAKLLIGSLTRACKLTDNKVDIRLPINGNLLELILFEVQRTYLSNNQPFLDSLYKAIFCISFYGLMRIGEVTESPHVIKACNIHIAHNKEKLLLILYTSKTHGLDSRPQKIKITSNKHDTSKKYVERCFCPFKIMKRYLSLRGDYMDDSEQFFIYRDRSPVTGDQIRQVLKSMITKLGLNARNYGMHSFRIGRTGELVCKFNYSISEVKFLGRWKSNVVYKYIRS